MIGLAGSVVVALYAWRRGSLSRSGAVAAIAVGTILFGAGSPAWFGTLLVFFFTSSAWSRGKAQLRQTAESGYEKGSRRDAGQVLANGGLGAALCLAWAFWPEGAPWPKDIWWYMHAGVMAAVTADTWATEAGALSRRDPVTVIGFRRVPRGTSGAVSAVGTLAAALGALIIGVSAWAFVAAERAVAPVLQGGAAGGLSGIGGAIGAALSGEGVLANAAAAVAANWGGVPGGFSLVPMALAGGLAGAFADSLLGATVQRMNRCRTCGRLVEKASHCGQPTERARGLSWMNNDAVNAISSAAGGLASLAVAFLAG